MSHAAQEVRRIGAFTLGRLASPAVCMECKREIGKGEAAWRPSSSSTLGRRRCQLCMARLQQMRGRTAP